MLSGLSGLSGLSALSGAVTATPTALALMDAVFALTTGANGDLMDATKMAAGWHGTSPGAWTLLNHDPLGHTTIQDGGVTSIIPLTDGVDVYDGSGTKGVKFSAPLSTLFDWEGFQCAFSGAAAAEHDLTFVALVKFANEEDPGLVSVNNDWINISGGGGYTVAQQIQYLGSNVIHGHSEGDLGNTIAVDRTKWYLLILRHNDTEGLGEYCLIDNDTGIVVGSSESNLSGDPGVLVYLQWQNYINNALGSTTFQLAGLNWTDAPYPVGSPTVPDPTSVSASQTNLSELTLVFASPLTRFKIEQSANAGSSWATLETGKVIKGTTNSKSYIDVTAVNGGTYRYRVTGLLGSSSSSPVTSSDATIDNSTFHTTWAGALSGNTSVGAGSGERGLKITVGANDLPLTHIGCWFTAGTYGDVVMNIYNSSVAQVATATVLISGATVGDYNYIACSYTLLAGQTYYITRDVAGFNEYTSGGTRNVNTSLAATVYPCDETGADVGGGNNASGVNFKI